MEEVKNMLCIYVVKRLNFKRRQGNLIFSFAKRDSHDRLEKIFFEFSNEFFLLADMEYISGKFI